MNELDELLAAVEFVAEEAEARRAGREQHDVACSGEAGRKVERLPHA